MPRLPSVGDRLQFVVCALLLGASELHGAPALVALPTAAMRPPPGAGWLVSVAGWVGERGARVLHVAVVLALVGAAGAAAFRIVRAVRWPERPWSPAAHWERLLLGVAAVGALLLLGFLQLAGTTRHVHHLLWLLAAMVLVPRSRAREGAAWALLAAVYVWPGLHKLWWLGADFFLTDHVLENARWKWLQAGAVPALAAALPAWTWRVGAAATLAFECGFPLLAWTLRGRRVAIVLGVGFHLATSALMGIAFPSLWLVLLALWPATDPTVITTPTDDAAPPRAPSLWRRPAGWAVATLVVAAHLAGASGRVEGWPFACYPTFVRPAGASMPALRLHATFDDGRVRVVEPWRWRDGDRQLRWGQLWALALEPDRARRCAAIEAFVRHEAVRFCPRRLREVRAERVWLDVDPTAAAAVRRRRALCHFAFAPGEEPVQCGHGAPP